MHVVSVQSSATQLQGTKITWGARACPKSSEEDSEAARAIRAVTPLSHAVQFPKYQLQLRKRTSIWYASRAMSTTSTLTRSQTGAESERDEAAVDYVLDNNLPALMHLRAPF